MGKPAPSGSWIRLGIPHHGFVAIMPDFFVYFKAAPQHPSGAFIAESGKAAVIPCIWQGNDALTGKPAKRRGHDCAVPPMIKDERYGRTNNLFRARSV